MRPNPLRGECAIRVAGEELMLRPSFTNLVAAEGELGSLIALIERSGQGQLMLGEITALFDHLSSDRVPAITRQTIGETLVGMGMSRVTPLLRDIFKQVLEGAAP